MAAPNVNGRLHLTGGVHQKPPASFKKFVPVNHNKAENDNPEDHIPSHSFPCN